ncbi:flagellar biosynthetic protein FliO [Sphingomonas sp. HITSZ_GF]|uniref:FliO/MopB family protein n=1 Tax=Sphingomonas sp. HITSZ_GF TaxID=3037247 RepID=UPI00240CE656|nr:flagellar biosynthetic protein FliO [Sphingomonas sp. HITSZ_GF]MDG2534008.1 flagellar biosynthetic protein FliO [Sphingomonas sp. HITSZ_GF]
MDILSMLRTLGALGIVLGMLAGALWFVKRYDVKLPGRVTSSRRKRIEIVERLAVDGKRSVALIRRDGMEHLVMFGPEGQSTIETGIAAPEPVEPEAAAESAPAANLAEDLAALRGNFAKLVDRVELPRLPEISKLIELPKSIELPKRTSTNRRATTVVAACATPAARPPKRIREPRNTTRWNRAAVRAALDA